MDRQPRSVKFAPVTVDQRALVDKMLARYPGEFTVFRELLQNSDDAKSTVAEIRFRSAAYEEHAKEENTDISTLPDLTTTHITHWTVGNNGRPFESDDWTRLTKIGAGNQDSRTIGAFGVGFYSVFSVTENPCVSSKECKMTFEWDNDNQLCFAEETSSCQGTEIELPLRKPSPMPRLLDLMRFLASSITFMDHLKEIKVFFDNHPIGNVEKSLVKSQPVQLPRGLGRSTSKGIDMDVTEIQRHNIVIKAEAICEACKNVSPEKLDVSMFTAKVKVTLENECLIEFERCMKKPPPSDLECSLVYTGEDEDRYDEAPEIRSCVHQPHEDLSIFQGLCANLRERHARIFIGHATTQTTGIGGHMASRFIPTIERELIDLSNDTTICQWNIELLRVGAILSRAVYEWKISNIRELWETAVDGDPESRPSPDLQNQLERQFLHILRFFAFYPSTPSREVSQTLKSAFHGCSSHPLMLLSSVGVCEVSDIRLFDLAFTFLKSLPMLSHTSSEKANMVLSDKHRIRPVELSDVKRSLNARALNEEELVSFLQWLIKNPTWNKENLAHSAILSTCGKKIPLSSIRQFIDPNGLGAHIPSDGPLPDFLLPLKVYKRFSREDLTSIRWQEFTVNHWLRFLLVDSTRPEHNCTQSPGWAEQVLGTLSRLWSSLPENMRQESKQILENHTCIPTTRGMHRPSCSYLLVAEKNPFRNLNLAIVRFGSGFQFGQEMEKMLEFIGVRTHIPPEVFSGREEDIRNGSVHDFIRYLVAAQIPQNEVDEYKLWKIFTEMKLEEPVVNVGKPYYRADELYPPEDIFRQLQLPVIDWDKPWSNKSGEAELLYRLGLRRFPPLKEIIRLCSSSNTLVREAAFPYLCKNLGSDDWDYQPDDFRNVAFIPAKNDVEEGIHLRTLDDVCWDKQWRALGFSVFAVPDLETTVSFNQLVDRLGIQRHPSPTVLLDRLHTTPSDKRTAIQWLECLAGCIPDFDEDHRSKLSGMQIVPGGSLDVLRWETPTRCFLGRPKDEVIGKLFTFVDFGNKANQLLAACGSKDEPSVKDIAERLVEDPEAFYKAAGGPPGFLDKLQDLATEKRRFPKLNDTLQKMASKRTLLAVHREYDDQGKGKDIFELRKPEEIVIVDDIKDGELFSESVWAVPQGEDLERFYASIGCRRLSKVIKEEFEYLHEIEDQKTSSEVKDLVLERLPIFLDTCPNGRTNMTMTFDSFCEKLRVRVCKSLRVFKTFTVGKNVRKEQKVWAAAKHDTQKGIELWISGDTQRDVYDLAVSLCRLLFGSAKGRDTLVLAAMLSDPELLKRAGFHVKQDPEKRSPKVSSDNRSKPMEAGPSASRCHDSGAFCNVDQSAKGGVLSSRETTCKAKTSPDQVITKDDIKAKVKLAIAACKSGMGDPRSRADQSLNSRDCKEGAVGDLQPCERIKGIQVHAAKGVPEFDKFMDEKREILELFAGVIISVADVFKLSRTSLHIFYDLPGGPIAFNKGGSIYLNLRFFEEWHATDVKNGNRGRAQSSWFFAFAHEIAHNLVMDHNSDHEFWFSAICEEYVAALPRCGTESNQRKLGLRGGRVGLSSFLRRLSR